MSLGKLVLSDWVLGKKEVSFGTPTCNSYSVQPCHPDLLKPGHGFLCYGDASLIRERSELTIPILLSKL